MRFNTLPNISRTRLQTAINVVKNQKTDVPSYLNLERFQKTVDSTEGGDLRSMSKSAKGLASDVRSKGVKKILLGGALMLAGAVGSTLTGGAVGVGLMLLASGAGGGMLVDTVIRDGNKQDDLQNFLGNTTTVLTQASSGNPEQNFFIAENAKKTST